MRGGGSRRPWLLPHRCFVWRRLAWHFEPTLTMHALGGRGQPPPRACMAHGCMRRTWSGRCTQVGGGGGRPACCGPLVCACVCYSVQRGPLVCGCWRMLMQDVPAWPPQMTSHPSACTHHGQSHGLQHLPAERGLCVDFFVDCRAGARALQSAPLGVFVAAHCALHCANSGLRARPRRVQHRVEEEHPPAWVGPHAACSPSSAVCFHARCTTTQCIKTTATCASQPLLGAAALTPPAASTARMLLFGAHRQRSSSARAQPGGGPRPALRFSSLASSSRALSAAGTAAARRGARPARAALIERGCDWTGHRAAPGPRWPRGA